MMMIGRKSIRALLLCATLLLVGGDACNSGWLPLLQQQPLVILDNDGSDDIDNVADLRLFNTLALNGAIIPVGYIAGDGDPYNASAAKALQRFQGLSYPIYAYQGGCCTTVGGAASWTLALTNQFNAGDSRTNYTSCELGYRQMLAHAPRKVNILVAGPSVCLDELLESPANDGGDGLGTGLSLIQAKVAQVVWVAGAWPSGTGDFNLGYSGTTTADLLANWPSSVPFVFYGVNLTTTAETGPLSSLDCQTSSIDPYQLAFFTYYGGATSPCARYLWAQPAEYFITSGLGSLFSNGGVGGSASYNSSTTNNSWTSTPGPFTYLGNVASQAALQSQVCASEQIGLTNWCSPVTITQLVSGGPFNSGTASTATTAAAPPGSLIVVALFVANDNDQFTGLADSAGNGYSILQPAANAATFQEGLGYNANSTITLPIGGAFTVTTQSGQPYYVTAYAISGANGGFDASATLNQATLSTSAALSTGTLAQKNEIVFSAINPGAYTPPDYGFGTYTEGAGFTNLFGAGNPSYGAYGYAITNGFSPASVTWAPGWTQSNSYSAILASFKIP
jgi:hypothetical protein